MALLANACRKLISGQSQMLARRMASTASFTHKPFPPPWYYLILLSFPIPVYIVVGVPRIIAANQAEGHHAKH